MSFRNFKNIVLPSIRHNKYIQLIILFAVLLLVLFIMQFSTWFYISKPNEAMSKYCPGWCCPHTCNNQLINVAFLYCKNHPSAKNPNVELYKLEIKFDDTTNSDCIRDSSTNTFSGILS